jgi:hypothetical protein
MRLAESEKSIDGIRIGRRVVVNAPRTASAIGDAPLPGLDVAASLPPSALRFVAFFKEAIQGRP